MKNEFLQLWGIVPVSVLAKQGVPADVAPPGIFVALSLGALIALGLLVVIIVVGSFLVIRAIKKRHTRRDDA